MLIRKIVEITDNREKAKEIAQRVIRRGNEEGRRFGDILQEELDKIKQKGWANMEANYYALLIAIFGRKSVTTSLRLAGIKVKATKDTAK